MIEELTKPTAKTFIRAPRERVFDVLLDPLTYPDWLLGAQRIRKVDPDWPEPGSSFHHTVGAGPIRISDRTTVVEVRQPERLVLDAHIGPFGTARVTFELGEEDDGTEMVMYEVPDRGLIRYGWQTVGRFLLAFGIWGRNQITLDQLRDYVERDHDRHDRSG